MRGTMMVVARSRKQEAAAPKPKSSQRPMQSCHHCKRTPAKLFQCICCDGPWYCTKQCQLADWAAHQEECEQQSKKRQLKLPRKGETFQGESLLNLMESEFVLGGPSHLKAGSPPRTKEDASSPLDEAKAIVDMLERSQPIDRDTTCNKTLWVPLLQRLLADNRRVYRALLLDQSNGPEANRQLVYLLINVMESLIESDMEMLENEKGCLASRHCHNKRLSLADEWLLPSFQVILELLRAFPDEEDSFSFVAARANTAMDTQRRPHWSPLRAFHYLHEKWEAHLEICCELMSKVLADEQRIPAPWIGYCVALWDQLVACSAHPEPARGVLWAADESIRHHGETIELGLKNFFLPLLRLLAGLKWKHNQQNQIAPLFECAYQVAALLVAQSQWLEAIAGRDGPDEFDLHSDYLERIILNYLAGHQANAWNHQYLPWAAAVVKRQAAAAG